MRASRAAELHDSNPWAHLALGFLKRHTDDAVVEYVGGSKVRPSWLSGWPSTGSRTEAYKVVWTGRCDWDCDSVLARIARLGSFMDTDPAKISGGITTSCGDIGSLAYGRGFEKLAGGAVNLSYHPYARARGSSKSLRRGFI